MKVPYKWVKRDTGLIAAGYDKKKDVNQQLVTPYGHVPKPLIDAKPKLKFDASSAAPPELIELDDAWGRPDLGLPRFRDAVAKNTNGELVLEWATVPDDILKKATTLGELCTALHASNKAVYPAYLYAKESLGGAPPIPELNQEGDSAYQLKMPMLLFEHWCNTELRYRVISGGQFSYSMDSRKIPTDASLKWKVLTLQPIPKKATVKLFDGEPNQTPAHPDQKRSTSCDQNVVGSAELDLLKGELLEIAALAQRTQQLLQKSHDQMVERARVTRPFLALNVMFQACAANAANAADRDAAERGKRLTERIYKTIRTKMSEKPMSELSGASLDPRLDSILVKEGVLVADIAAAIKANCHKLREKILRPSSLTGAFNAVFATALRSGDSATPRIQAYLRLTVQTLTGALEVIGHEPGTEGQADELWKMIESARSGAALKPEDLRGESPLEVALSAVGFTSPVANMALGVVGNLAGPPSLSIGILQTAAGWSLPFAAQSASASGGGSLAKMNQLQKRLLKAFEGFTDFAEVAEFNEAVKKADHARMWELREKFGNAISGESQGTVQWKAFTNVLQIAAFVGACNQLASSGGDTSDEEKKKGFAARVAKVVDFSRGAATGVAAATSGASLTLGVFETVLTETGQLARHAAALGKIGNCLGYVGCVIGMVQGACDVAEGLTGREVNELKVTTGAMTYVGSAVLMAGMMSGCPPAMTLGIALNVAAAGITLIHDINSQDRAKNGTNRVVKTMLGNLDNNLLFATVKDDVAADIKELLQLAKDDEIPYAANAATSVTGLGVLSTYTTTVESLRRAGFGAGDISRIIDGPVTFEPLLMVERRTSLFFLPPQT